MPLFGEADAWAAEHSLACFAHGYLMFGFEFVLNVMGTNDVFDVNGRLSFFLSDHLNALAVQAKHERQTRQSINSSSTR